MYKATFFILFFAALVLLYFFINSGCTTPASKKGEETAKKYCGTCHVYPEPKLLPKKIWKESILPEMAAFANYYRNGEGEYLPMSQQMVATKNAAVKNLSFAIEKDDWEKIVSFYLSNAPEKLSEPGRAIDTVLKGFDVLIPSSRGKAYTSALYTNTKERQIFIGDIISDSLHVFSAKPEYLYSIDKAKGIVDIGLLDSGGQDIGITHIGNFKPTPPPVNRNGFVEVLNPQKYLDRKTIADSLDRPVKTIFADVNNDGLKDFIVCQFGFLQGELSLFMNSRKGYTKKILCPLPGAIQIYKDDISRDGFVDFWVLFAGAFEGIVQFINKGNSEFEQRTVASFPPSYGSTYFELVDFNKDGKKDILYTCGDNADNSQVLKPYHGIYLFENAGNTYRQAFFFPLNGCYKAELADYDLDGDLDIAAIAFFADYEKHPEEGFVYLENKGNNTFTPHTFSSSKMGRWACMESVDYDADGDTDILLGNLAAKPGNDSELMRKWENGPNFIILRNNTK